MNLNFSTLKSKHFFSFKNSHCLSLRRALAPWQSKKIVFISNRREKSATYITPHLLHYFVFKLKNIVRSLAVAVCCVIPDLIRNLCLKFVRWTPCYFQVSISMFILLNLFIVSNISAQNIEQQEEIIATEIQNKKNFDTKNKILETDRILQQAIEAYNDNDYETAKQNYNLFLDNLKDLDVDETTVTLLLSDFENIINKIKMLNDIEYENKDTEESDKNEISLEYDEEILDKWMTIYTTGKGKERVKTALERSGKYSKMIQEILKEYDLPQELQYLPIIESLFNNNTVSRAKAVGLWQIMAHRGRALGLQINYWIDERKDPVKATRAAAKYLKQLYAMFNDWHLALAAYNRGEYGIIKDLKFSNAPSALEMSKRKAIPKETQNYVPQFIVAIKIAQNPQEYGFEDLDYQKPEEYDTVLINKVIDLKIIAKCAETTVDVIRELNPALLAWCSPHGYQNFELKLPLGSQDIFLENINKETDLNPSPGFVRHKVKKGDYLEKLAVKYKTTVKNIKNDNPKLKKQKYLNVNQVIIIRPGRAYFK